MIITSTVVLLPLSIVLVAAVVDAAVVTGIALSVVVVRWLVTCRRALRSYRNELALMARPAERGLQPQSWIPGLLT